ncbi:MAG: rhomboid family intramembrane serine protease [Fidelibacterota bacterium]
MFIPYKDDNPRILIPYVTWGILILNVLVFVFQMVYDADAQYPSSLSYGTIPSLLMGYSQPIDFPFFVLTPVLTLISSMFMHGSIAHILGNMLFLYVFADNIESILGHRKFLLFYLLCGIIATLSQVATNLHSTVPIVGASGAISGVMAAYLVKYPKAQIHVLIFIFPVVIPAAVVVGFWFITQLINGAADLNHSGGGVAWFAHIGGFISGVILLTFMTKNKFKWKT